MEDNNRSRKPNQIDADVTKVINSFFKDDNEVLEVALFMVESMFLTESVVLAIARGDTEVSIPPEAYHRVKRFDNGLSMNKFYIENYAIIRSALTLSDTKMNTALILNDYGSEQKVTLAFEHIRSILLSKFDPLSTLMYAWKGVQAQEEFDAKMRMTFDLTDELKQYFKDQGV